MSNSKKPYLRAGERVRQVRVELDGTRFPNEIPDPKTQKKKVSQESFAAIIDIPLDTLRSVEQGRRPLNPEDAKKISDIAEYPAPFEWLMGKTDFRNEIEAQIAEQREQLEAAKDLVKDAEHKDDLFAVFMIQLEEAANEMDVSIYCKQRESYPVDGVTQKIIDATPLHYKPNYYDYFLVRDSKTISKFSGLELKRMQKRLARQARLLIEEMIEEGENDDGEH